MKRPSCFVFWLFIFSSIRLQAQFDSLTLSEQARLSVISLKARQADTLNEWAFQSSGATAHRYAAVALILARQDKYPAGIGDACVQLGSAAQDLARYAEAEQYYNAALHERLQLKHYTGIASCYNRLAQIKRLQGHYGEAVNLCQQGLKTMKNQPLHINTAYLFNTLGTCAKYAGQYQTADSAFQGGIHAYSLLIRHAASEGQRRSLSVGMANIRMNAGAFLQESRHLYAPAKDSLLKSLREFKKLDKPVNIGKCLLLLGNNAYYTRALDTAAFYYQQGLDMQATIEVSDYHVLLKNRGRIAMEKGLYAPAYRDFQSALQYFSAQRDTPNIANTLFEMGNWHYEQAALDSATAYYQKALETNPQDQLLKGRILYFLSDALDLSGQKDASVRYTQSYVEVLNQLRNSPTSGAFNDLIQHQLDKNHLLKRLLYREKSQAQQLGIAGVSALFLLLLLALSAVRLNRQKRRIAEAEAEKARQQKTIALQIAEKAENEQEIARQNEQIAIQEKLELIKNRELETHYARLEAQDDLQKQIGRDLHDGIGAMLTAVKLNLSPVDEVLDRFPSEKRTQYSNANRLLDEACQELRRVSHELGSAILTQFGLKAQLEAFANILKESGKFEVELNLHGLEGRFDKKMEVNIYRIIQELIGNIIKHAQANKIIIQTNHLDNMINIMVEDDGKGFDLEKAKQKPGQGLISIEARVHDLKGVMFIDTRLKRGTVVSIDIPLFPKDV